VVVERSTHPEQFFPASVDKVPGFRTSEVIGTDVYSNAGNRIGEVEDFAMSGNGYFYAVVDVQEGALERTIELTDDELVVVPWNQLRVSSRDQVAAQ
jgi:sporulation protein YlmC with PRC-barrel domain